jgi:hypothetical protein
MADWFEEYLNTLITRMQMHPGNDNLIFQANTIRLAYLQGKQEGRI